MTLRPWVAHLNQTLTLPVLAVVVIVNGLVKTVLGPVKVTGVRIVIVIVTGTATETETENEWAVGGENGLAPESGVVVVIGVTDHVLVPALALATRGHTSEVMEIQTRSKTVDLMLSSWGHIPKNRHQFLPPLHFLNLPRWDHPGNPRLVRRWLQKWIHGVFRTNNLR